MSGAVSSWVLAIGCLLLQLVITCVGTIFWMMVKALQSRINERKEREEKLERDLQTLQKELPQQYVQKDDYVRSIVGFEKKLDEALTVVTQIANNFQVHVGLSGAPPQAESSFTRLPPEIARQRGGQ